MTTLYALVAPFHCDSADSHFQYDSFFFQSSECIESHQSMSNDDRIQDII